MRIRRAAVLLATALVASACGSGSGGPSNSPAVKLVTPQPSPPISTEWVEYHRDAARSGHGPDEPALNAPQVAWRLGVDGDVYASPLIVAGHVIVATENNTVYSLDMFTGATVWQTHLGEPVDASTLPCGNIGPKTGITGTPAADPVTHRLYVVAFLQGRHHMLYGLSLVDGSIASQQDVDPEGSTPAVQQQRGGLAVGSGFVYVPLGGLYGDCGPYHGYVVAVPTAGGPSLTYQVPARGAGIWSPQGVTLADDGSVYVTTGNGGSRSKFDYSNAVVELSPDLQTVKSYFAPSNWVALNDTDTDLGSVGATLMAKDYVFAIGKEGVAYLLRGGALGGIGGEITSRHVCSGAWGGTAWLEDTVFVPCADGLYALSISTTSIDVRWRAAHPLLGSPITAAGAVWAIDSSTATLYALDPSNGRNILFKLELGRATHFSTPAATEGFVIAPAGQFVVAIASGA